jgi:mannose-1-phosphate guanylyltransferase
VTQQLLSRAPGTVIIQPANKETGPGILLPLMHVYKKYPGATVAVFPSDHFIVEEDLFMDHVEIAFRAVERNPSSLILLGTQPHAPEPEYGYIVPGREADPGFCEVLQFVEKPAPDAALKLIEQGGLWNTMVIVFKVKTMLNLVRGADLRMYHLFERIFQALGTAQETDTINDVYGHMETVNFSKGLLEKFATANCARLLVFAVRDVRWSDWGSERRITTALQTDKFRHADKAIRNQEEDLRRLSSS